MKEFTPYLNFDGNCREAMTFYKKCLNAEELDLVPFPEEHTKNDPKAKDKVMHARLKKGTAVVMASDAPSHIPFSQGSAFWIMVPCASIPEIEKLFTAFSENGKVTMPLSETFWATRYGALTDQFGVNWMFNLEKAAASA
jgi:PhnB protein